MSKMLFDFGTGKLSPVVYEGRSWVRFDDLVRFLEGDREVLLAETLDSSSASRLVTTPDGTLLLAWEWIPMWMFVFPTSAIAPEHRDGHTVWCRRFLESPEARELGEQMARDFSPEAPQAPLMPSGPGARAMLDFLWPKLLARFLREQPQYADHVRPDGYVRTELAEAIAGWCNTSFARNRQFLEEVMKN